MNIILIGFMATGKTTVSQLLGAHTKLPVFDLDQEVVRAAQMSIPAIFAQHGEQYFRDLEHQVLADVIKRHGILATGGGTPTKERNRQLIMDSTAKVIFLRTSPQETLARLKAQNADRPIANKLNANELAHLQASRQPFYTACADQVITTDHLTPEQITKRILTTA